MKDDRTTLVRRLKNGDSVSIGDDIILEITSATEGKLRVEISAPRSTNIVHKRNTGVPVLVEQRRS
ncbi:carbon storage regulator [Sagittula salina]|uniref:Carbon storage regulator n=1 Tax=Sagittula salina TaxID=2820268 RepID=A0A940S322_9RHOB|nr:carbon storage regulator [Sagittula salina]MBP0484667.1 carbon storage regulator [Sagittula salina]